MNFLKMGFRKLGFATLSMVWNSLFSMAISTWEMECKHSGYDSISCKGWVWVYVLGGCLFFFFFLEDKLFPFWFGSLLCF